MLELQSIEPCGLIGSRQCRFGPFCECEEARGVRTSRIRRLPGVAQPLESKLTDRLEHRQPWRSVGRILPPHQAVVHERRAFLEHVTAIVGSRIEQHGGIVQAAAANEDRQPSEHRLLTRCEQVVAP